MNNKAAIYIRVSTHWQVDKDSLQVQRRELIAYCEMILDINDYEIFEDPGFSAKNTDRPAYQEMMSRLRTGEFSHLLVWKIDRISRNLLDFTSMYSELKNLGITFVSKNEKFDTSSAIGEAMLKIILVFAELERQMTAERVSAVMLSRANNGQWNGGKIPYGYDYDKETKTFSVNQTEEKIYQHIADRYEETASLLTVARELTDAGIKTRSGANWSAVTVRKMLTSIFYLGHYRYNIRNENNNTINPEEEWITIENHHPALISQNQYDRIQHRLVNNRKGGYDSTKNKKNIHIFSGILVCSKCGRKYTSTSGRRLASGCRPSVYGCPNRRRGQCDSKYITENTIAPFIFTFIGNILRSQNTITKGTSEKSLQKKLSKNLSSATISNISEVITMLSGNRESVMFVPSVLKPVLPDNEEKTLTDQIRRYENALKRLQAIYLYSDSEMSESEYASEQNSIKSKLSSLKERLNTVKQNSYSDDEFIKEASYFMMTEELLKPQLFDYEKFKRTADVSIAKAFINNVISDIEIKDSQVVSIRFKNNQSVNFKYEQ